MDLDFWVGALGDFSRAAAGPLKIKLDLDRAALLEMMSGEMAEAIEERNPKSEDRTADALIAFEGEEMKFANAALPTQSGLDGAPPSSLEIR